MDLLNSVYVTFFIMIHMGTIFRHAKFNQRIYRFDSVVYKLGALLGSVGHKVSQDNRLPPPRTLIMDFTMTHVRFGRPHLHPIGQLSRTRRSDGAPDPDGDLQEVVRI